jgi:hypothetical protein
MPVQVFKLPIELGLPRVPGVPAEPLAPVAPLFPPVLFALPFEPDLHGHEFGAEPPELPFIPGHEFGAEVFDP